jgi:hypothetical protein
MSNLLKDNYPEIFGLIDKEKVPENININLLTSKSSKKLPFCCPIKCYRCGKYHSYEATIANKTPPASSDCPVCTHRKCCPCITPDEFLCNTCHIIKPKTEQVLNKARKNNYVCKQCMRNVNNNNIQKSMRAFYNAAKARSIRDNREFNITPEYLFEIYQNQNGCCDNATNKKLVFCKHKNWKCSIERINNNQGYIIGNIRLICVEFQTRDTYQFTKEVFHLIKELYQYNKEIDQEVETQKAIEMVSFAKDEKNNVIQDSTIIDKKERIKDCITRSENTLRGRLMICLTTARSNSKKRAKTINVKNNNRHVFLLTLDDLYDIFIKQCGRCYYSNIPLEYKRGMFQISLERLDVTEGYTKTNVVLIIAILNVSDKTILKIDEDEETECGAWNKSKIQEIFDDV